MLPMGFESERTIPRKRLKPFFKIDSMLPSFCRYGGVLNYECFPNPLIARSGRNHVTPFLVLWSPTKSFGGLIHILHGSGSKVRRPNSLRWFSAVQKIESDRIDVCAPFRSAPTLARLRFHAWRFHEKSDVLLNVSVRSAEARNCEDSRFHKADRFSFGVEFERREM